MKAKDPRVARVKRSSAEMIELLRKRFPDNQYAFLPQVRDAAGFDAQRTIDALVMSVWPSRGLELMGIEIKVDRRDWLRELAKPEKADGLFGYMDRWYLVASEGVVGPGELPPTWGLIEPHSGGLATTVEAPKLADPKPIDRSFLAAILRKTARVIAYESWDSALSKAREEGIKAGMERLNDPVYRDRELAQGKAAIDAIAKFKEVTGIDVGTAMRDAEWTGADDVIPALRWVIEHGGWEGLTARLSQVEASGHALVKLARSVTIAPLKPRDY